MEEVFLNADGQPMDPAVVKNSGTELGKLLTEYSMSKTPDSYVVGTAGAADQQQVTIVNRRSGVKDVTWYKHWKDIHNLANGQRPDIYLDIYSKTDEENSDLVLVTKDYLWEAASEEPNRNWTVTIQNLPKYDHDGYAFTYYAQKHTNVDFSEFDYVMVQYGYDKQNVFGNENGALPADTGSVSWDQAVEDKWVVQKGNAGPWYLKEDGTFINQIQNTVVIVGHKLWKGTTLQYTMENLPIVTFRLYRTVRDYPNLKASAIEKPLATIVLANDPPTSEEGSAAGYATGAAPAHYTKWKDVLNNGEYNFRLEYEGYNENVMTSHGLVVEHEEGAARSYPGSSL